MMGQETIGADGESFVPFGTLEFAAGRYPPINRWAILFRPFGTRRLFLELVVATVLLCEAFSARAASKPPAGRDVYKQECARCHGKSGEGVKGKYEDPLRGDRTLEKLTRYIERAMPDDNPGKCTGDQTAAVARFIYDSFYSRE